MPSMLTMESVDCEIGAFHVQRTHIDFASQMENLNKLSVGYPKKSMDDYTGDQVV